jgi:hypothetical protein
MFRKLLDAEISKFATEARIKDRGHEATSEERQA